MLTSCSKAIKRAIKLYLVTAPIKITIMINKAAIKYLKRFFSQYLNIKNNINAGQKNILIAADLFSRHTASKNQNIIAQLVATNSMNKF